MTKTAKYVAHAINPDGTISYTPQENNVWSILYNRQVKTIPNLACKEFIEGIDKLTLQPDAIPQPYQVNESLLKTTGWSVEPVAAVIPAQDFFTLLADKKFPAASFIRTESEIDYLQEPDIFHEIFGHCPLLTLKPYADFVEQYGKLCLQATPKQRRYLFRIFWFTIEFGLIQTDQGLRILGGGILSSYEETLRALRRDPGVTYSDFDVMEALRTPFRIDMVQPHYFIVKSFDSLYDILDNNLFELIDQAIEQGDYDPKFNHNPEDPNARYN